MTIHKNSSNSTFLAIQGTYSKLSIALFRGSHIIDTLEEYNTKASSHLIFHIDSMLYNNNLKMIDISFMVVDQGPGAFTSLRATLSTVNGIAFALKIPIVGVTSLDALIYEAKNTIENDEDMALISILNAYSQQVYYKIHTRLQNDMVLVGCSSVSSLLTNIRLLLPNKKLCFVGNAVSIYEDHIKKIFNNDEYLLKLLLLDTPMAETIGVLGYEIYMNQTQYIFKIEPLYLKSQDFTIVK